MMDDMYSLLEYLNAETLRLHNLSYNMYPNCERACLQCAEEALQKVIDKIEKSPMELHRTLTLPREFDYV